MPIPHEDLEAAGVDTVYTVLDDAIATARQGTGTNVAVVSDPFGGRTALLDYVEAQFDDVERVDFSGVVSVAPDVDLTNTDAVLFDGCHYLYTREIGGFAVLDRFLERIALSNALVVTAWNRYSWAYLSAVRDVAQSFPVHVEIPPLSAAQVENLVTARFGPGLPAFVATREAGRIKTVQWKRRRTHLGRDRSISVPVLQPNPEWLSSWATRDEDESIEAAVYEKVRRASNGNPGVATTIWEQSVRDGEIAPAYVNVPAVDLELDDDQTFLLWLIVAMEDVSTDALASIVGMNSVDKELQTLTNRGVIEVTDGSVAITETGLSPAVSYLQRGRLLW